MRSSTMRSRTLLALTAHVLTAAALVAKDGKTGKLPALGFNSWNAFRCDIHEDKFLVRHPYIRPFFFYS
jgi:alpha-galactosidase